ncbi:MAG: hypothetical protein ACTSUV_01990 [Candidatus Ranarchaeia archaeon]
MLKTIFKSCAGFFVLLGVMVFMLFLFLMPSSSPIFLPIGIFVAFFFFMFAVIINQIGNIAARRENQPIALKYYQRPEEIKNKYQSSLYAPESKPYIKRSEPEEVINDFEEVKYPKYEMKEVPTPFAPENKSDRRVCNYCGLILKKESKFCPACGAIAE